jgi:endonuclease/exonuclease/phosphatase family metal-dependent hydrolase
MTAIVSRYRDALYNRDYRNDLYLPTTPVEEQAAPPSALSDYAKRVALVALPFLSLEPVCRFPISVAMGACRVGNSGYKAWHSTSAKEVVGLGISVIAFTSTLLHHRIGIIVTTIQDILIEINTIAQKIRESSISLEEILKSLFKILNHLIYLALISVGGLEISIAAFLMQAIISLIQSRDEFKKGRWIEGFAHLLMAGIRVHESYLQYQQLERKWEIQSAIRNIHVGELQEKWKFPSDHLPVGVEVNGIKLISWNVLNDAFMSWVEANSQGLAHSDLTRLSAIPVGDTGLTLRHVVVVEMIKDMMKQGAEIVALQECGNLFLHYLETQLTSDWGMIRSSEVPKKDQEVVLYRTTKFTYDPDQSQPDDRPFQAFPSRSLQKLCFLDSQGTPLHLINGHIPGDPKGPSRQDFADTVAKTATTGLTIACGDYNFEREEMLAAFARTDLTEFSFHSPYTTNIDPSRKYSKCIDHVFVHGNHKSRDLKVGEILTTGNLREMVDLLNQPQIEISD